MGFCWHARIQRHFHRAKHGLFVMVEHQGQDVDHLAVTTWPTQHMILQLQEPFWHLNEGRPVAQRAGFALNHRQIMVPVINNAPWLTV